MALVQLRDSDATTQEMGAAVARLRDIGCPVVVNGHVVQGAGVHLPERRIEELPGVRAFVGTDTILGVSAHSVDSVLRAAELRADYVQIGTMFPTQTHPDKLLLEGPTLIQEARDALVEKKNSGHLPSQRYPLLIGVGGINLTNAGDVIRAGADGVAVIRALSESPDPAAAAKALLTSLKV